ncbi:Ammonium transporter 1 member 3-like [Oopsacas minuta]|uniref:Ammonium transporter 1 member 3-like n=1 Tax=Oopsacas minuta TaxID=111878 RepID=A0AAV7JXF2_9METZ|nr:Ammonium transporter 1 member 3-like [Oopsacas minuta]
MDSICLPNGSYNLACQETHLDFRYTEAAAAWTLLTAMIIFFMRAGFLMIELSFAVDVPERRNIVLLKYLDVAATAIAFWLFGFELSKVFPDNKIYENSVLPITSINCKKVIPYIVWFFKYGFASNTATLMGGLLIRSKYKLRLGSAFFSSFFVSGLIHCTVARIIWGGGPEAFLSPFRFCIDFNNIINGTSYTDRLYLLDFAGGGAVHLVGGVAALTLTLFVSFQLWMDRRGKDNDDNVNHHNGDHERAENFQEYMYPDCGGQDQIESAALGVFILWFGWFAFNCGTTESLEGPVHSHQTYSNVAGRIAVNMITCAAGGGLTATIIAGSVQFVTDSKAINCNEIANGILTALVSITSNCPFVDNISAFFIGVIAIFLYHIGVFVEYKLNLFDTGRVIPVHAFGGIWSLISTAIFTAGNVPNEYVKETYEGVCYCILKLPTLGYGERIGAQIIGALFMILYTFVISFIIYFTMYMIRPEYLVKKIPYVGEKTVRKLNLGKGGLLLVGEATQQILHPDFRYESTDNRHSYTSGHTERLLLRAEESFKERSTDLS